MLDAVGAAVPGAGRRPASGLVVSFIGPCGGEAGEGDVRLGSMGRVGEGVSVILSSDDRGWVVEGGVMDASDRPCRVRCEEWGVVEVGPVVMEAEAVKACRSAPFMLSAANTAGVLPLPSRRVGSAPW